MAIKIVIALAVVAAVSAGYIPQQPEHQLYHAQPVYHAAPVQHTVPVVHKVLTKNIEEYDSHPQYKFSYGVDDKVTGDNHGHHEERDGDSVHGEYFLIDSDGYKRTVTYTADAHSGFNAVVHREPLVKVAHAAPVAHYSHAPEYIAPVAHYTHAPEHSYHAAAAPSYYHH